MIKNNKSKTKDHWQEMLKSLNLGPIKLENIRLSMGRSRLLPLREFGKLPRDIEWIIKDYPPPSKKDDGMILIVEGDSQDVMGTELEEEGIIGYNIFYMTRDELWDKKHYISKDEIRKWEIENN